MGQNDVIDSVLRYKQLVLENLGHYLPPGVRPPEQLNHLFVYRQMQAKDSIPPPFCSNIN